MFAGQEMPGEASIGGKESMDEVDDPASIGNQFMVALM
jgi:hypothetical protein